MCGDGKEAYRDPSQRYKCHTCKSVVTETPCPVCNEVHLEKMCELDHIHCTHDISFTIKYCEKCGQPVCPVCNTHDVIQLSRVTGYYQSVEGWNNSKKQELKDRHRYDLGKENLL
jgi:hypothetical protein